MPCNCDGATLSSGARYSSACSDFEFATMIFLPATPVRRGIASDPASIVACWRDTRKPEAGPLEFGGNRVRLEE